MSTANNDCNMQSIVLQLVQQNNQLVQQNNLLTDQTNQLIQQNNQLIQINSDQAMNIARDAARANAKALDDPITKEKIWKNIVTKQVKPVILMKSLCVLASVVVQHRTNTRIKLHWRVYRVALPPTGVISSSVPVKSKPSRLCVLHCLKTSGRLPISLCLYSLQKLISF